MKNSPIQFLRVYFAALCVVLANGWIGANGDTHTPAKGIHSEGMDLTIPPGEDFYLFATGAWHEAAIIKPGDWNAGSLEEVRDRTEAQTDTLLRHLRRHRWPQGSDEAKFMAIYRSYLDRETVRRIGMRPTRPFFENISQAASHKDIALLLGSYQIDAGGFLDVDVRIDPIGGKGYVGVVKLSTLLLGPPDRYLRQDATAVTQRDKAAVLLGKLLRKSRSGRDTDSRIAAVLRLETALASVYPPAADGRVPIRPDQIYTIEALQNHFSGFDWANYLAGKALPADLSFHVPIDKNLPELVRIFNETPPSTWRDYLRLRFLMQYGPYLTDSVASLVYRLRALRTGVTYRRVPRRERARDLAIALMPDVIGRQYAQTYPGEEAHASVQAMVGHIRAAYRERLLEADWLSADTRTKALEKLAALQIVIGAPPEWNDYSGYTPDPSNLFGNVYLSNQLIYESDLARLYSSGTQNNAPDSMGDVRGDIFFSPLNVGAYYLPDLNTIIIPAAYLQAPYYDPQADPALNFGALGTTLGHELGHAFDDQGSKRGATGQLGNWWAPQDREKFDAMGAKLSEHMASFEAVPGIPLDTALTLGENLSDLTGLTIAFRALELSRSEEGGTTTLDMASRQAFFLSYAWKRRSKRSVHIERDLATTDPHSPPHVRVNGILPHIDAWYEAFDINEEDPLWIAPEQRVRVW